MDPLPKDAPLWLIVLITDLADGAAAVVVVLHHVIADGLGGLNVLAALLDPGMPPAGVLPTSGANPSTAGSRSMATRVLGVRQAAGLWRSLRQSMFAGGGFTQRAQPHARWCSRPDPGAAWRSSGWIVLCSEQLHIEWATTNDGVLVAWCRVAQVSAELEVSRSTDSVACGSGRGRGAGEA